MALSGAVPPAPRDDLEMGLRIGGLSAVVQFAQVQCTIAIDTARPDLFV
jgi:hypothetical protein